MVGPALGPAAACFGMISPTLARMKGVLLAGGLGTRLRSIVADRPKAMAQICDKPFVQYLIEQLRVNGVADLVLCVGYGARSIQDYFGDGQNLGVRITYVVERELLGTAGALRNARQLLDSTFLLLNGDSFLETDLAAVARFHRCRRMEDPDTLGTLAAVATDDVGSYGALDLDQRDRILHFKEKTSSGPGWINAGVYVLDPAILDVIPDGVSTSLERETLPSVLLTGKHLYACRVPGKMVDIGTAAGYAGFDTYVRLARADNSPRSA